MINTTDSSKLIFPNLEPYDQPDQKKTYDRTLSTADKKQLMEKCRQQMEKINANIHSYEQFEKTSELAGNDKKLIHNLISQWQKERITYGNMIKTLVDSTQRFSRASKYLPTPGGSYDVLTEHNKVTPDSKDLQEKIKQLRKEADSLTENHPFLKDLQNQYNLFAEQLTISEFMQTKTQNPIQLEDPDQPFKSLATGTDPIDQRLLRFPSCIDINRDLLGKILADKYLKIGSLREQIARLNLEEKGLKDKRQLPSLKQRKINLESQMDALLEEISAFTRLQALDESLIRKRDRLKNGEPVILDDYQEIQKERDKLLIENFPHMKEILQTISFQSPFIFRPERLPEPKQLKDELRKIEADLEKHMESIPPEQKQRVHTTQKELAFWIRLQRACTLFEDLRRTYQQEKTRLHSQLDPSDHLLIESNLKQLRQRITALWEEEIEPNKRQLDLILRSVTY